MIKKRYLLFFSVALLFVACSKEHKTWRDYGDYYSFYDGCLIDGEEYHEMIRSFGRDKRYLWLDKSSTVELYYHSPELTTRPYGGKSALIRIYISMDSSEFSNERKWKLISPHSKDKLIDGEPFGTVYFYSRDNRDVAVSSFANYDLEGWMSFSMKEIIGVEGEVENYSVSEMLFEFDITMPNGSIIKVSDGYARLRPD